MATSCTVSMTSRGLKQTLGPLAASASGAAVSSRHDAGDTLLAAARGLSWTPPPTRHLMRPSFRAAPAAPIRASLPRSPRAARPRLRSPSLSRCPALGFGSSRTLAPAGARFQRRGSARARGVDRAPPASVVRREDDACGLGLRRVRRLPWGSAAEGRVPLLSGESLARRSEVEGCWLRRRKDG